MEKQEDGTWNERTLRRMRLSRATASASAINLNKDTARLAQGRELARGFMLDYNMYRHYFPAPGAWARTKSTLAGRR